MKERGVVVDRNGDIVELVGENQIIPDGHSLRVKLPLQDGRGMLTDAEVDEALAGGDAEDAELTDAEELALSRVVARDAYLAFKARLGARVPVIDSSAFGDTAAVRKRCADARARFVARLSDRWKPHRRPAELSPQAEV
jgi:hypothetical protein